MLGTEPRRLERYAHNLQRAIRAPDHGPLHRRWVANRTADATSIRPEILRSVRQIDSLALENPSISVPIGHSISRAELPSTTQNWQHCTDVYSRLAVRRLEGWPLARSRLWPSFETRARARSSGRGSSMHRYDSNLANAVPDAPHLRFSEQGILCSECDGHHKGSRAAVQTMGT